MSADLNHDSLGAALGRIPSGVFIVTATHSGSSTAMLASWVQQAAFDPPLVSVAVSDGRPIKSLIEGSGVMAINVLADGQNKLMGHFAKGFAPEDDAFDGIKITTGANGSPILSDALAWLECRVQNMVETGDHVLYIAEVTAGSITGSGTPYVHLRKSGFGY